MGFPFETIVSETEPTITKERIIETTYSQQLVRVDYERVGWEDTDCIEYIRSIINVLSPDLIVISDYRKGLITKSLAEVIMSTGIPVLGDLKPGNLSWFRWALAIKPNFKEFQIQVGISGENTHAYIEMHGPALAYSLDTNLIITRSEHGVSVVLKNSEVYHMPILVQDVFDVTGAGDTFIAAMAVAICEGKTLLEAALFGNKASAIAVGKIGTVKVKRREVSI